MNADLIARFEACTLPPEEFRHEQHVYVAWSYLRTMPLLAAAERFIGHLKQYAAALGKANLYHDTITWAYLLLVHERMRGGDPWSSFREANPDLFSKDGLLRYYRAETLKSDRARERFLFPDNIYEELR